MARVRVWLRRVGVASLGLVVLGASGGAAWQRAGTRADERRLPPAGEMVTVDGRRMHLHCTGSGSPAVLLDAGLGGSSGAWASVQPELARSTRVCSYDRSGLGASEPRRGPRTSDRIVAELRALLDASGETGPWVLVGHSFGGINMRLFASQHPDEVVGLVLVDASHEDQVERLPAPPGWVMPLYRAFTWTTPFGSARLLGPRLMAVPDGLDEEAGARARAHSARGATLRTAFAELNTIDASLAQVRAARVHLGALPVVVITAGLPFNNDADAPEWVAWLDMQRDMLSLSSVSHALVAERSGHMVPRAQPEIVVAGVHCALAAGAAAAAGEPVPECTVGRTEREPGA
jgi:pimeloyl-ACP methyl ester carboxylesterase